MIDEKEIMPLNFFAYGGKYSGEHHGMKYLIKREGEKPDFVLKAYIWQGPYASCCVNKDDMTVEEFEFSEEGRLSLINWLKDQYESRKDEWDSAPSILNANPLKH
jgi:hypothetical protein